MIDKPITSKFARLVYNGYKAPYLTCLTIQEIEEKAKRYDELEALHESDKAINKGLVEINKSLEQENQILKEAFDIIEKHTNLGIGFDNELEFNTKNADVYERVVAYALTDEECKIIEKVRGGRECMK